MNLPSRGRYTSILTFGLPILLFIGAFIYFVPSVQARVRGLFAQLSYRLNPPEEAVFVPGGQEGSEDGGVDSAENAIDTPQQQPTRRPTPIPTQPALASAAADAEPTIEPSPTPAPTPQPPYIVIDGVDYQSQLGLWNYCGPANLAMALSFWGPEVDRTAVGDFTRGENREDDKNVNPYEMQQFVEDESDLNMIIRMGGDEAVLKRLVSAGFPVIIEKGYLIEGQGWMGHYLLINGYDDENEQFITQDSFAGPDIAYDYTDTLDSWRAFNYVFMVAYPSERELDLAVALEDWTSEEWALQNALEIATEEAELLEGRDQFFAAFNIGTSQVHLSNFEEAATAYDGAFAIYSELRSSQRPWRTMWYQTGPYWAYYETGRYQDVRNLADTTLNFMNEPILEETYYWRGLANEALGNEGFALADMRFAVELNPNFSAGKLQLARLLGE